ncbi:MAG: methylenetetrahydrofolate reductase [Treponema sp.]|jgi:methylenetetrahydrofolate reductase (NADPH)|nr:methylenetetrahydrofolate reductase [Treponema sp.]
MVVSLEVVPRNREALISGAAAAAGFPAIGFINVPDLIRFSIRSWEACGILAGAVTDPGVPGIREFALMPHLRAIDFDPDKPFPHTGYFRALGINRVLVIAGDPPPPDIPRRVYPVETVSFIKKLKAEMPELAVYAAFDPYRTNIRYELDYLSAKEDAGAEGFFSQPFFDLRLMEIYAEYLAGKRVFWGISPVLSPANRNYWESRNRAIFPKSFRADLYWNVDFGRRVLGFCETNGFNLYLMPIKVDITAYLSGIFG